MMPKKYAIIVPILNEADSLKELVSRIEKVFIDFDKNAGFEILFIDDGSTDNTPNILEELLLHKNHVRRLTFRRNYGKSLALMAGFLDVDSDIVITMDGDLQDDPDEIPILVNKLATGFDLVAGWRIDRNDKTIRKFGSKLFNYTVTKATRLEIHDLNCGFKAYKREAIESLCLYGEYHRYVAVQAHLNGFKVGEVAVSNNPRKYGISKYKTFRYQGFFDLLSLLFIHKYGLKPLHFFGVVSAGFSLPGFLILFWLIGQQVLYLSGYGDEYIVLNRPVLALSLTSIMIGILIFLTGFVCDFILHHNMRDQIPGIVSSKVKTPGSK